MTWCIMMYDDVWWCAMICDDVRWYVMICDDMWWCKIMCMIMGKIMCKIMCIPLRSRKSFPQKHSWMSSSGCSSTRRSTSRGAADFLETVPIGRWLSNVSDGFVDQQSSYKICRARTCSNALLRLATMRKPVESLPLPQMTMRKALWDKPMDKPVLSVAEIDHLYLMPCKLW